MSVNSSSFLNVTLACSKSNISLSILCFESIGSYVIFIMYTLINVLLLLPLYVFVLYIGFQRWRQAGQTTSHSDFLTYHLVALEVFGVFGSLIYVLAMFSKSAMIMEVGSCVMCVIYPGQALFHLLTCVERYLAVVHPVSYMRLRETGGARIRNFSIFCVWLLCFGWVGITKWYLPHFPGTPLICLTGVSAIMVSFYCLSVLWVLTRPGPGEVGRDKEVDQSKRRAFHIITAITGVLLLRCFGLLLSLSFKYLPSICTEDLCALLDAGILMTVPSSLVLPLLFLNKSRKLVCCRHSTESAQGENS